MESKKLPINVHAISGSSSGGGGGGSFNLNVYYKLISRNSGQALDVVGASTANGALVDQWPDSGSANQQWSIIQV